MPGNYDIPYIDIEWRFSGLRPSVFGLDPMVIVVVPLAFAGLRFGFPTIWFVILGLFVVLALYVAMATGYSRVVDYLYAQRTKYVQRGRWPVE